MSRLLVTCAILFENSRILACQHRANTSHPFMWEFPGGKIEEGESPEQCIQREIKEELDVEIEVIKPLITIDYDYPAKKIKLIPFLCRIKKGQPKALEHHQIRWQEAEELVELDWAEADKKLIVLNQSRITQALNRVCL